MPRSMTNIAAQNFVLISCHDDIAQIDIRAKLINEEVVIVMVSRANIELTKKIRLPSNRSKA